MLKKAISVVITLVLLMCVSQKTTSAAKYSVDAKLRKMGVPEELIQNMMQPLKEDITKNCLRFVTSKKVFLSATEDKIIPCDTIPSTDLEYYISVYEAEPSDDGRERYTIYIHYKWLKIPLYRLTDPYGVAWNDTRWRPVENSSYNLDSWRIYTEWYGYSDTALAYASSCGVGWNAKWPVLKNEELYFFNAFEGFGRITIESQIPGNISGNDKIYANYYHTYGNGGTIGLQFQYTGVFFSGTQSHNSRGTSISFDY